MQTYYGSFGALEQAFGTYLGQLKPGPGRPVLVVCPSGRVADYLRRRQVRQDGIVSNVFFMTLSQLISQLDQETPAGKLPLLPGDQFHDYLLKNLLLSPGLNRYPVSRGFVSAVRESLRDLADSLADPAILQEHLYTTTDPVFLAEEAHWKWLVNLYENYQARMNEIPGFRSYQQYFADALAQAEKSAWLREFNQIIFYGFYEFTGRQLELFHTLRAHYPLTVFWVYASGPAFTFGRKFFETNILGNTTGAVALPDTTEQSAAGPALQQLFTAGHVSKTPPGLHLACAPDPEGELFFVVKEMLRLHEEEGIAFADMALTARSLEPYQHLLPDVFAQNAIALQMQFAAGINACPLGVFVMNILSLARNGFEREDILAIVTSPYFKQSNQWRYLIEKSLAKRDFAQWVDLVHPQQEGYDPGFLKWLEKTKNELEYLEKPLAWSELCAATLQFLQENMAIENLSVQEQSIWQQLQDTLHSLVRYESVAVRAREREFLEELLAAFQNIHFSQTSAFADGVTAVEVSALRGLRFKAVFVLGMNEKIFPQVIREDPVLKDNYRRILRDQLGFWINQKMERFEEERLLFFCTVEAGKEQVYLSFLRADEEGKPLVPSSYLAELARAAQVDLTSDAVMQVRGRLSERLQEVPFTSLTAQEVSWLLAAQDAPEELYQEAGLWGEQQQASRIAARQLASAGVLTERDGLIASGPDVFQQQNAQGFSPSALQDLARCPMKYFLAKGLGLKEKDEALSREALAPNLRGSLYHEVLMDYYEHLYKEGLAGQLFDSAMQERVKASLSAHYTNASYKTFGIYPVIWQLLLQDIEQKLEDFVVQDGQQLAGYVPSIFETYFEKMYQPSKELQLKLKGIIDRIDIQPEQKTFRIIDYKSSRHGGKDLAADMFKYVILQPFIYLILAQNSPRTQGLQANGAALLNINTGYKKQELTEDGFESIKARAAAFFKLLATLIQKGQFFINPGEHCTYCPYSAICRKDSFRAVLRTRHHPLALALEEAKQ